MSAKKRTPNPPADPEPVEVVLSPAVALPAPAPGECRALGCGQRGNHLGGYCCDHYRRLS